MRAFECSIGTGRGQSIEGMKQGRAGVGSGLRLEGTEARALAPRAHGGQSPNCRREESRGGR